MLKTVKNGWAGQVWFHRKYLVKTSSIHEIKPVLVFDQPTYMGSSMLDLRKLLIYEIHYNCIQWQFHYNYN